MTSDGIDLAVLEADVAEGRADAAALERATEQLVAEVLAVKARPAWTS